MSQPLLASSGGHSQDRSAGRFIGVHLKDGGVAVRELDADLHLVEGRNQGCPLGTEPDPDLLFKPSTIHGSILHEGIIEPLRYRADPNPTWPATAPGDPRPTLKGEGN